MSSIISLFGILFCALVEVVNVPVGAAGSASGGLDTLPHNGVVLALLAVSNCRCKESCALPPA